MSAFAVLFAHFRGRFFGPEDPGEEGDPDPPTAQLLACVAGPGVVLPFFLWIKYIRLWFTPVEQVILASWWDRSFFLCFTIAITGVVTLVVWDVLFPDEADFVNLAPLPVPARTIFAAKAAALGVFVALLILATNGISGLLFPVIEGFSIPGGSRLVAAHLAVMLAASLFVFFTLAGAQGVLAALLPARLFRRVSSAIQAGAVLALLGTLFSFSPIAARFTEGRASAAFPPFWFLGLYDRALGGRGSNALAARALVALGVSALAFGAGFAASYRRFVKRTLETAPAAPARRPLPARVLGTLCERGLARDPSARALFDFTLLTVARSRRHQLAVAAWTGAGLALALQGMLVARGASPARMAAPLAVTFLLAVGLRSAMAAPVELRANWALRAGDRGEAARCMEGARRAVVLLAVLPAALLSGAADAAERGVRAVALPAAFDIALGLLLVELLLAGSRKMPFASERHPGGANLKATVLPWTFAFVLYAYGGGTLAARLAPWALAAAAGLLVAAAGALAARRTRRLREDGLALDELPELPMMGLDP